MFTMLKSVSRSAPATARRTAAAAGVAAVGLVLATAPAATAAPTSVARHFHVPYGNSYADGYATFTNRWVTLDGTLHAVGCGRVVYGDSYAAGKYLDSASSTPRCDGNWPIHIPVPADVVGGADSVLITLAAPDGTAARWAYRDISLSR
ncbi:hypothetical protein AB0F52_14380 [Amycolatopsis sp. NPDC024027]|uniref:hypothetical protein n=1 Tax=Amycolatopsis sp. NPDC024027 TaxID=3154327 RepID=UPI0033EBE2A0